MFKLYTTTSAGTVVTNVSASHMAVRTEAKERTGRESWIPSEPRAG